MFRLVSCLAVESGPTDHSGKTDLTQQCSQTEEAEFYGALFGVA